MKVFFFLRFVYFRVSEESESMHKQGEKQREREKQAPQLSKEPDVGLDPKTLRS